MKAILCVGLGGFTGSVLRYLVALWIHPDGVRAGFPWATLVVNVAGCFAIGVLGHLVESRQVFSADVRLFLFVGVLGGFTTFSAFGNDTVNLFRAGNAIAALINVAASVTLCLAAVWLGRAGAALLVR